MTIVEALTILAQHGRSTDRRRKSRERLIDMAYDVLDAEEHQMRLRRAQAEIEEATSRAFLLSR